ncbi:MAG: nuclear transport factor 2 family protein [Caulobacter sp.]|nr:nuclear transport factor 2 family protein [Caulobacter sp.]
MTDPVHGWHDYVLSRDPADLSALIAEDCVFESPVVHSPQVGKAITEKYLLSALQVLNNDSFEYLGEWRAERSAVLEFACVIDGIRINGVDMIWWNEAGLITRFKVMVRPLKAINLLHQKMGEMLMKLTG